MEQTLLKSFQKDKLTMRAYVNRTEMGKAAAADIAACMEKLLAEKETLNMVFAAAPSQNDVLECLMAMPLPWNRVNAFHMDEYEGLSKDHPQSFGHYLDEHVFKKVPFKNVYYVADYQEAYEELMEQNPIDIVCLGIGENGHIAFNDPGVADFNDPKRIKKAKLDDVCRMQQVHDGCFPTLNDVPKQAMTLTMSCIMSIPHAICVVPTDRKANAIRGALEGPVTTECPASILRRTDNVRMYIDKACAGDLI